MSESHSPMEASEKTNHESSLFLSEKNDKKDGDDHVRKSKSQSGFGVRPFRFRHLLTCGTADTNESVLVRRNNKNSTNESVQVTHKNKNSVNSLQICKTEVLGGSGTCWNRQNPRKSYDDTKKQRQNQSDDTKKPVYRAMQGPTCSQCGKPFKPEKMHKHMKSCRGLKAMAKAQQTHQFINRN